MKRTTIMLPDHLHALLDRERRRRDTSAAAVVREALEAYLAEDHRPRRFSFIGIGHSGRSDIASNMEEILAAEFGSEEGYNRVMYGDPAGRPASEKRESDEIDGAPRSKPAKSRRTDAA